MKIPLNQKNLSQTDKDPKMSRLTTRLMATVVTLAVGQPLFAQTAPEAQTESGIIVTADRAKDEEAVQDLAR